jgi:hypothetical protein
MDNRNSMNFSVMFPTAQFTLLSFRDCAFLRPSQHHRDPIFFLLGIEMMKFEILSRAADHAFAAKHFQ